MELTERLERCIGPARAVLAQGLAAETLAFVRSSFPPEARGDEFGKEVLVPDEADAMTRLVGGLGRQP
jgi:hypothetical protein